MRKGVSILVALVLALCLGVGAAFAESGTLVGGDTAKPQAKALGGQALRAQAIDEEYSSAPESYTEVSSVSDLKIRPYENDMDASLAYTVDDPNAETYA